MLWFSDEHRDSLSVEESWSKSLAADFESENKPMKKGRYFFEPVTELAVDLANSATDRKLGKMDMYRASELIRKRRLHSVSVLTGILYTQRYIASKTQPLPSSSITSTDLFFVSMMLASKYLYDEGTQEEVFNDEWAEDFNLEVTEVNELEAYFLNSVKWRLYVSNSDFRDFIDQLDLTLATRKLTKTDWPTSFQELSILIRNKDCIRSLYEALELLGKTMVACSLVYIGLVTSLASLPSALNRYQTARLPTIIISPNNNNRSYTPLVKPDRYEGHVVITPPIILLVDEEAAADRVVNGSVLPWDLYENMLVGGDSAFTLPAEKKPLSRRSCASNVFTLWSFNKLCMMLDVKT